MRQPVASAEAVDATVLEEAADDRLDPDVFREALDARPQAADAAHDEFDRDTRLGRLVERVDDPGIDQRIHLHPDYRWAPRLGMDDLGGDVVEDALLEADRGH